MRSRLWQLILRELPFPFRELGTELVRIAVWLDKTAAQIWLGFARFPAWYLVSVTGTMAFVLTALLFLTFADGRDPAARLQTQAESLAPATRDKLEEVGDWAAQDKWRLAHMFVSHRPAPESGANRLRRPLVRDPLFASVQQPGRQTLAGATILLPETEVQLNLGKPRLAEQPKRLVSGPLVREAGSDARSIRRASYRTRDSRLLVQAEWVPGRDCDSEIVLQPRRRIIPVPDPQWDELPPLPPIEEKRPDLSFTMSMLREFLPPTGEFPPRSRLESISALSEFPESFDAFGRTGLLVGDSPWTRTEIDRPAPEDPAESYADRFGGDEDLASLDDDREPRMNAVPSFAEIVLHMELFAPESAVAGRTSLSSLVLKNDGLREIPLVTVRESLADLETVLDAIPPARVDQFENLLERKVRRLEPGNKERLELVWRPDSEGLRTHSALIFVRADVGATTEIVPPVGEQPMPSVAPEPIPVQEPEIEPEPAPPIETPVQPEPQPGVSLNVRNKPSAIVDDLVEIEITVRNTGDVPLHDVRVVAELPSHLKHRRGAEVEYAIQELPVSGVEKAVLRVVAQSAGTAICKLQVAAAEPARAKSRAVVDVQQKPELPKPVKPEPVIVKAPAPKKPAAPCCCPVQPAAFFEDWQSP